MSAQLEEVVVRPIGRTPSSPLQISADFVSCSPRCVRGDVAEAGRPVAGVDGPGRVRVGRRSRRARLQRVLAPRPPRSSAAPRPPSAGAARTGSRAARRRLRVSRGTRVQSTGTPDEPHAAEASRSGKVVWRPGVDAASPPRTAAPAGRLTARPPRACPGPSSARTTSCFGEQRGRLGEPHGLAQVPHPVPGIGDLGRG